MTIPHLPSYEVPKVADWPVNKVNWAFDASRAALLIHDMQEYFVNFFGPASPLIEQVTQAIACLRAWCKARDIPIIYTAQPLEQSAEERGLLNDMWGKGIDSAPHLAGIVPQLRPEPADLVLCKWRYSAFQKSDLA